MASTIYNSDLTKEIIEGAKLQLSRDKVPSELAERVLPVMEVNPRLLRRINVSTTASKTTTGSTTSYSVPANGNFFLTNITFSLIKDATCDAATGDVNLNVVQDGETKKIIGIPILTTTAQSESITLNFAIPMKLDKSSTITNSATYTAGLMIRTVSLQGYLTFNDSA